MRHEKTVSRARLVLFIVGILAGATLLSGGGCGGGGGGGMNGPGPVIDATTPR
jgi:hypothetical protein